MARKPRATISFDEDVYQVLTEEQQRRSDEKGDKVSLASIINDILGGVYANRIAILKKQKLPPMG